MTPPRLRPTRILLLALIAGAGSLMAGAPHAPPSLRARGEEGHYPSDWFFAQRAFPVGAIDQVAVLAAVAQATRDRGRLGTSGAGPAWQAAGPFNIGGRVTALAVVPGGTTIYLGSANGGVFRSNDAGVNWTSVFDDEAAFSIGALALDPADPSTIYCGTGEANSAVDTYDGSGVYRSQDGGQSWQHLGLEETRRIGRVAVDPSNPDRIFVAAMGTQFSTNPDRGLYRSQDGGQSWSKVLFVNDSTGCADVVINPAHPETVYCATWERIRRPTYRRAFGPGCGIWRSIDSGTSWTRLSNGLPTPTDSVGRIGLAIAPSRPSMVYAQIITGAIGNYSGRGMYRTADGGATWARRDITNFTTNFLNFGWYFGDMAVDPVNADKVYALGVNLVRSTDGGTLFSSIIGNAHVDHHAIWIDPSNPNRIYLGNDGGFWSSTVGGTTWTHASTLDITQFYAGAIDPSNPARLLGGTQDNSTPITSGSPTGWGYFYSAGDGFYCLIDPTNPNVGFAETQYGSSGSGPHRTVNGGGAWSAPTGISGQNRFNWNTPFVMNPSNHNLLLVGSQRVWRSTNNGESYSFISGDLTTNSAPSGWVYSTITTLDISAADTSTYYVGTDDGKVWRSINRGGVWTNISAGLPVRWVTRVTADPVDPQVVYVTLSGFSVDESVARVYRSTNRGTTWTPIAGNLPNIPVNDLLVDPADTQRLYAATDLGVYWTPNLGTHWTPLGAGLPFTAVFDLTFHAPSRTLVAATHGRSQWKLDLTQPPVAVAAAPAARLALSAPRPNPSRGEARLTLELGSAGRADVAVFDAAGRRVRRLLDARLEPGRHVVWWDGRDDRGERTGAGVYFVSARVAGDQATRRVVRVE